MVDCCRKNVRHEFSGVCLWIQAMVSWRSPLTRWQTLGIHYEMSYAMIVSEGMISQGLCNLIFVSPTHIYPKPSNI